MFLKSRHKESYLLRTAHMTDEELLLGFWQTNKHALIEELFERYTHIVYGICLKYLGNEEDAKDMAMLVFERLLIPASKSEVLNFKSWIYTLTKNQCLMDLRKTRPKGNDQSLQKLQEEIMDSDDKLHHIEVNSTEEALHMAIIKLNTEQRSCIELFYLNHHSYAEIVTMTGFTDKQVKSHIQNGKRNLKIILTNAK